MIVVEDYELPGILKIFYRIIRSTGHSQVMMAGLQKYSNTLVSM